MGRRSSWKKTNANTQQWTRLSGYWHELSLSQAPAGLWTLTYGYGCPSSTCTPAFVLIPLSCLGFRGGSVGRVRADTEQYVIFTVVLLILLKLLPRFSHGPGFPSLSAAGTWHGGYSETLLFGNPAYLYAVTRPHAHDGRDYFLRSSLFAAVLFSCFPDRNGWRQLQINNVSFHVLPILIENI